MNSELRSIRPVGAHAFGSLAINVAMLAILYGSVITSAVAADASATSADYSSGSSNYWWAESSGEVLPQSAKYENEFGMLEIFNANGPVDTNTHPFFEPQGKNGRACVTCHQPADGMSISAATARARWAATQGRDPLFAMIDGANCPNLPVGQASSHSLLLNKGLFRVSLPWPPKDAQGNSITPEFSLEVFSDPTGCNTSTDYGVNSAQPRISVYRRPRVAANLKYVEPPRPLSLWSVREGYVLPKDPNTGAFLAQNLMADGRVPTLRAQMRDAIANHLEGNLPSKQSEDRVREFELQIYAAQVSDKVGGSLQEGGASLGPKALLEGQTAVLGAFPHRSMFPELEGWRTQRTLKSMTWQPMFQQRELPQERPNEAQETPEVRAFRDSVVRGYDLFMYRQFLIRDISSLTVLTGNPTKQSCADCHNMQRTGMDNAPGYLDLGTSNYPTATPAPDLPLFKLTCRKDTPPHPYLGRVIYTSDPGRALITGKCVDIGSITAQQMRALAGRAPYFAGGSAANLREVIEFYERRFKIGLSEQDIQDLVNFMRVL